MNPAQDETIEFPQVDVPSMFDFTLDEIVEAMRNGMTVTEILHQMIDSLDSATRIFQAMEAEEALSK